MFHLEALAERLVLRSIFQNMTFFHYVQRLANVTKIAKLNLPSIHIGIFSSSIKDNYKKFIHVQTSMHPRLIGY